MRSTWPLTAVLAALLAATAAAQQALPRASATAIAGYFETLNLTVAPDHQSEVFVAIVQGGESAQTTIETLLGGPTRLEIVAVYVTRAREIEGLINELPTPAPKPQADLFGGDSAPQARLGDALERATLSAGNFDGNAPKAAASEGLVSKSVRVMVSGTQGEDGKKAFGTGAMYRVGVGKNGWSVGGQAGLLWSGTGQSDRTLRHEMVDWGGSRAYPWEVFEDTRRHVSGLNKFRFAGVSAKTPYFGDRVAIEGGVDLAYANLNTRPEIIRETYIREFVYSDCYDSAGRNIGGNCDGWEKRTLSRDVLARGQGDQQSGFGHTKYLAAEVKVSPKWAVRVEAAKDTFKAFPEASGKSLQGGVVYNIGGK